MKSRGLCGHHAEELEHNAGQDDLRAGRKASTKEGQKEGGRKWRKEAVVGKHDVYAVSLIFRFVWWHNDRCKFLKKQKIHITRFWFLSHHSLFTVAVCGLGELLMCKGINWAKMRFNHKARWLPLSLDCIVWWPTSAMPPRSYAFPTIRCFTL